MYWYSTSITTEYALIPGSTYRLFFFLTRRRHKVHQLLDWRSVWPSISNIEIHTDCIHSTVGWIILQGEVLVKEQYSMDVGFIRPPSPRYMLALQGTRTPRSPNP